MVHRPTATIIRRNFYHRNYKYYQINESKLSVHFLLFRKNRLSDFDKSTHVWKYY